MGEREKLFAAVSRDEVDDDVTCCERERMYSHACR